MKFFIDTANLEQIRRYKEMHLVDGVHVVQAAQLGADVATLPPAVFDKLLDHPLTTIGLEKFLADWAKPTMK